MVHEAQRVSSRWVCDSVRQLGSTDFHHVPALRGNARGGPGWFIAVRARLRRSSLDARLARGANPCESSALVYRAARLTSERSRQKMAGWLEEILATASRPARGFSAAVEPDRREVALAEPLLIQISERLRSSVPVYARGVAMLEGLLGDGGSSADRPIQRAALSRQLELIAAALDGREQSELSSLDLDDPGEWT